MTPIRKDARVLLWLLGCFFCLFFCTAAFLNSYQEYSFDKLKNTVNKQNDYTFIFSPGFPLVVGNSGAHRGQSSCLTMWWAGPGDGEGVPGAARSPVEGGWSLDSQLQIWPLSKLEHLSPVATGVQCLQVWLVYECDLVPLAKLILCLFRTENYVTFSCHTDMEWYDDVLSTQKKWLIIPCIIKKLKLDLKIYQLKSLNLYHDQHPTRVKGYSLYLSLLFFRKKR